MSGPLFEELDYRPSPIGTLGLRRRRTSSDAEPIYEIKLDDGYLMSSRFTAGEIALAERSLAGFGDRPIDVVVGGLGLGYTANAALDCANVRDLIVVEAIAEVVEWHERHLVPLGEALTKRCRLVIGDFFSMAAAGGAFEQERPDRRYHAILVDIDHSPAHLLHPDHASFYRAEGLRALSDKLLDGGVFGLWSTDRPDPEFVALLEAQFHEVAAELVEFENPYQESGAFNTIYTATKAG